jgi:hypothetical protein
MFLQPRRDGRHAVQRFGELSPANALILWHWEHRAGRIRDVYNGASRHSENPYGPLRAGKMPAVLSAFSGIGITKRRRHLPSQNQFTESIHQKAP